MAEAISAILFTDIGAGAVKVRFQLAMRAWERAVISKTVVNMSDKAKRDFINNWLNDFTKIFSSNEAKVNVLKAFSGAISSTRTLGIELSIDDFLDSYREQLALFSRTDFTKAMLLRNDVASRMKDYKTFYLEYDKYLDSAQTLGLSQPERVNGFLNSGGRKYTNLRDSFRSPKFPNGRLWKPERYASMYANTRGAESYDNFFQQSYVDNGGDIVQVSQHGTTTPVCLQYEGKFFSLTGRQQGIQQLTVRPPYHPNCKHILQARPFAEQKQMRTKNIQVNTKYNQEKANFTKGQKRTIRKQNAYIVKNRPLVAVPIAV